MADLMPRVSDAMFATREGAELVPRVPRRVQRVVDGEIGRGLVRSARALADAHVAQTRIEGAAFVARLGLSHAAELTRDELRYLEQTPTTAAANRYRAITDAYAALVVNEVIKLSRE